MVIGDTAEGFVVAHVVCSHRHAIDPPIGTRILIQLQNGYGNTLTGRAGRLSLWSDTLQMLEESRYSGRASWD